MRFHLTEREWREYSLARAILISAQSQDGKEENSLELEISQTIERHIPGARHGGIFVPWSIGMGESPRNVQKEVVKQKAHSLVVREK